MTRQDSQRHARRVAAFSLAALAWTATAWAADAFPSKPVTVVVPFPPGGSNDLFARMIAKDLGNALKQPVVIDNRPGAGGSMGALSVARATPDGYTLLLSSSTFVTTAVTTKLPYDIHKSFSPIGLLARGPLILVVNNQFPAKDPRELIAEIKKYPGKYNYASAGQGSLNQFSMELLKTQAGNLQITHVPYRGGGAAMTELIGNQTQVYIASAPAIMPMVRNGKIKGIAVTSLLPSPVAPDLPTIASAVPGYEYESWWGVLAPAGTPPEIVSRLNQAVNSVIRDPAIQQSLLKEGAVAAPGTPTDLTNTIAKDFERLSRIAKQQNIVAE